MPIHIEKISDEPGPYPADRVASEEGGNLKAGGKTLQTTPSQEIQEKRQAILDEISEMETEVKKAMEKLIEKSGDKDPVALSILERIFNILSLMTKTIQQTALLQAKELDFTTARQKLYIKAQSEVKLYNTTTNLPPDAKPGEPMSDLLAKVNNANSAVQNTIENIRGLREMQGEDAKKIQATMNVSDDAQKGLLEFQQNLLQKMRELLTLLWR